MAQRAVGALAGSVDFPPDAVEVGRVSGAWGVRGWIRVQPYSEDPQALLGSNQWFLRVPEGVADGFVLPAWAQPLQIAEARPQAGSVVASAQDLADRDQAQALKGCRVFVPRSSFPVVPPDEYYWVDLIGLAVVNRDGDKLGRITGLIDTGVHPVLRVAEVDSSEPGMRESASPAGEPHERLIPFVDAYIDKVDLSRGCVYVDWVRQWDAP